MPMVYPVDKTKCIYIDGPEDKQVMVNGRCLIYDKHHNGRFSYLYEVPSHLLIHNTVTVKWILVYIVDADAAALKCTAA